MAVFFRSLGPLEIVVCGDSLPIGTPRTRTVLATLLARRGGLVSVDQLIDELWPHKSPSDPRTLVHGYVSRLRRSLGAAASRIVTRKPGYLLQVGGNEWDVYLFEQSIADARAVDSVERSIKLYAEAHKQWLGEPFADVPQTATIAATALALTELRLAALEEWFETRLAIGSDPELVTDLTHHVAAHPLREQLIGLLMQALHRSGRRADALTAFRLTRVRLIDELGVEPGADLQRLHQQVLQAAEIASVQPGAAQLPVAVPGFVGRRLELAALDQASAIATITGTAGVGKSTLAVQWAHRVQHLYPDGQLFVNLRGFDPERSAVDPDEALHGFLEALGVAPERIPAATDARAALYRSVLADKRVLVVLDNALDVEQVRPLLPGGPGSLAVVTSRDQLTGLVAMEGAHPVTLEVLSEADAADLLAARLGATVDRDALARIVKRCAGLPLALAVVAASSALQPGLSLEAIASDLDTGLLDAFGNADPKADLRSVFSWSFRALSPDAAQLFLLLGLHPGPSISVSAAASLAGTTVTAARGLLLELNRAQLVAQHQPGRFSSHDLLKAYARELAAALDPVEPQTRLLNHYLHTSHAAACLLDPNREPIPLGPRPPGAITIPPSSYREAMAWFEAEHAVLVGMVSRTGSWHLAWTMSTFLRRKSYGRDWVNTQQAALTAAQRDGDLVGQANAAFQLAMAQFRYGGPADSSLQLAVEHFRALGDHYGLASTYHLRCLRSESDEDYATAFSFARKGFEHYQLAGHVAGQGRALAAMGWYHAKLGNLRQGLDFCQAALALSQQSQDITGAANLWDSLGHISLELGELDSAVEGYRRSVALYRDLGDRYNLVRTLIGLGDTHHARGEPSLATAAWREALTLATELGHPEADLVHARIMAASSGTPRK